MLTREINDIICEPGMRLAIDITGCNKLSIGKNSYAYIKIDYGSGYMFTMFLKKTSEATEDFINFYKLIIKRYKKNPKYI